MCIMLTSIAIGTCCVTAAEKPAAGHKDTKECKACCKSGDKCDACCHDKGKGEECKACCSKKK